MEEEKAHRPLWVKRETSSETGRSIAASIMVCAMVITGVLIAVPAALANPGGEKVILLENSNVTVTFNDSDAAYHNALGFCECWDPVHNCTQKLHLFWGNSTPHNTTVNLGYFAKDTELIFYMDVYPTPDFQYAYTYYTGPGSRNPDGVFHAELTNISFQYWEVGFENVYGGGDHDYNDVIFWVKGENASLEFGDAPDPTYPSNFSSDGARHNQSDTECLGLAITTPPDWKDFESDANVPDLDNFDDGLLTTSITAGKAAETVTFEVTDLMAPSDLYVNILIDLNRDGDWTGPGEHVVANQLINIPSGQELVVVSTPFSTAGATPGTTWLRMTLTRHQIPNPSWDGTMADTGLGWDRFEFGETEDWEIDMEEAPTPPGGEPPEVPAMTPPGFVLVMISLFGLGMVVIGKVNR